MQLTEQMSSHLLGFIDESKVWQATLIDSIHKNNWRPAKQPDLQLFSAMLTKLTASNREDLFKARILASLKFGDMDQRQETIAIAYQRTFNWIFDMPSLNTAQSNRPVGTRIPNISQPRQNFSHWLEHQHDIYWVTGKPGCGKSTLMKYIFSHRQTANLLAGWSQHRTLVTAGFFFWNSGTSMQMSSKGLLQTILYQALEQCPSLVPHVLPARWARYQEHGADLQDWTWSELEHGLRTLVCDVSRCFAFFIDGLDEFDGDCKDLNQLVLSLTKGNSNVKMCLASRPWLVFEEAFQQKPWLRVEDLTAGDIKLFVTEKLQASEMFSRLQVYMSDSASDLIAQICDRSSGVFLWVYIVVESVLEGLRDGDTLEDLHSRMRSLPTDLEDLFRKILHRLNPIYFMEASKLFQYVKVVDSPLTLLSVSLAQDGIARAMAAKVIPLSPEELAFRAETTRRRLLSRCKGLLEAPEFATKGADARVQYLHRTVKDFFGQRQIWEYIVSGTPDSFNPSLIFVALF
jgi:hypothetical protein